MKGKRLASLIIIAVLTVVFCFVAKTGIGEDGKFGIENIKLGLDLSGGVSIVYQAEIGRAHV